MPEILVCDNCSIVIRWQPTIVDGKVYCCMGCVHGGPCECDYDNLPQPGDVNAIVCQGAQDLHDRFSEATAS